jgi:hypothetical protein
VGVEIYNNTITTTSSDFGHFVDARGGQSLIYSNTLNIIPGTFYLIGVGEEWANGVLPPAPPHTYNQVTNQWQWDNTNNGSFMTTVCLSSAAPNYFCTWPTGNYLDYHNAPYTGSYAQPYPHPLVGGAPVMHGDFRNIFPNAQINETDGPATTFIVRENGSQGAVTVDYHTVDGTAVAGINYTSTNGTLSWADGDSSNKQVDVPLIVTGLSGTFTFGLQISNPTGGATMGTPTNQNITIIGSGTQVLNFQNANSFVSASGNLTNIVLRTNGNGGTVTINYTSVNGTALSNRDYTAISGTLTLTNGVNSSQIVVPITYQNQPTNRVFTIVLSGASGANLISPGTNTVTIVGNPPPAAWVLTVAATNTAAGVPIIVSPNDTNGLSTGTTTFIRHYSPGTTIIMTATNSTAPTNLFSSWTLDSQVISTNLTFSFIISTSRVATAVYKFVPLPPQNFTLQMRSMYPSLGVNIRNTPDFFGIFGGATPYSLTYPSNTLARIVAPLTNSIGFPFDHWIFGNGATSTNADVMVLVDMDSSANAIYTTTPPTPGTLQGVVDLENVEVIDLIILQ